MEFPDYYRPQLANVHSRHTHYLCTAPVSYRGGAALKSDLDNLKAALATVKATEAFVPATSVSSIEDWNRNGYYKSDEDYLFALAEAIGEGYRAIVDAGFLLQVDHPHLVTYYVCHPDKTIDESAIGSRSGSRPSIMPCAASLKIACASTHVTASISARACTTSKSSTSSTFSAG